MWIEKNENENITTQNLWDTTKAVLRGRFIEIQVYLKKQEKSQINNLTLSTAFIVSHRFWVVMFSFSFISMHILISFCDCWLFRSVLFSLHMLGFLIIFLL